jgi:uncharacterized protein YjiS (DUF1127 family)
MNTAYGGAELEQTTASMRRFSNFFRSCWGAFQEWHKRKGLPADLCGLSDSELMDIGITRGEIDYIASKR